MRKYIISLFCLSLAVVFCNCGGGSQKQEAPDTYIPEMYLTEQDTTDVYTIVNEYMDRVVNKDFDGAVNMLVEIDPEDQDGQVWPIDDQRKAELRDMLSFMPIQKYSIEKVRFKRYNINEVRVKAYIDDNMSTYWYFKPVRYIDKWYLTLMDTMAGDRGFDNEE